MKTLKTNFVLIFVFFFVVNCSCQIRTSDFYKLIFYPNDSTFGFYTEPDSLKNNPQYSGFAQNLWAFNLYLYSIYSKAEKENTYLNALIPDSAKIKNEHSRLLDEDKDFQKIFNSTLKKRKVPDISIDSIQLIASRFTYLHRSNDKILIHTCASINGLRELKVSIGSPYYNAFCFMINYNDDCYEIRKRTIEKHKDKINEVEKTLNEDKIIVIRNEIYESLAKDKDLRQLIIHEYEAKKDYLNFKIIY